MVHAVIVVATVFSLVFGYASPTAVNQVCRPMGLNSPWQRYVSACEYSNGEIRVRNITAYTVLNLEYRSPLLPGSFDYPLVPSLDPGETPSPQAAAWLAVGPKFLAGNSEYRGTHTILFSPGMHLTVKGPDFYLRTVPKATLALYSAYAVLRYERAVEASPNARDVPLPGLVGLRQKADACAQAAGTAYSTDRRAFSGSVADMQQGLADTLALSSCKTLISQVRTELAATTTTAERQAEQEAAYAKQARSFLKNLVTRKMAKKVSGPLIDFAFKLLPAVK